MKTITHNGTEYRSGEPPSLGWWPTLVEVDPTGDEIRWWDGMNWSCLALKGWHTASVSSAASIEAPYPNWQIFWADRPASWPEWSRT